MQISMLLLFITKEECLAMYIDLKDISQFIFFCVIITGGILCIIALVYVIKFVKQINKILLQNTENINNTLKILPDIAQNFNDFTLETKETIQNTNKFMNFSIEAFTETSSSFFSFISSLIDIMKTIFSFFSS